MIKKLSASVIAFIILGFLAWEYKVSILIWSLPKLASITMPVSENIPASWTKGSEIPSGDDR